MKYTLSLLAIALSFNAFAESNIFDISKTYTYNVAAYSTLSDKPQKEGSVEIITDSKKVALEKNKLSKVDPIFNIERQMTLNNIEFYQYGNLPSYKYIAGFGLSHDDLFVPDEEAKQENGINIYFGLTSDTNTDISIEQNYISAIPGFKDPGTINTARFYTYSFNGSLSLKKDEIAKITTSTYRKNNDLKNYKNVYIISYKKN